MRTQLNDLIKLIKGQWRAIKQNMYLYCNMCAIILECATLYSCPYLHLPTRALTVNEQKKNQHALRLKRRFSSVLLFFMRPCWVNMSWNASTEIAATAFAQTNVSGLGALLSINAACIYSRARVVLACWEKKKLFFWVSVFMIDQYDEDTRLYSKRHVAITALIYRVWQ